MKRTLVWAAMAVAGIANAIACNLSDVTLMSSTNGPGSNITLTVKVCFGGGTTGTSNGADGDTRTFTFSWYDSNPGFAVQSWTPTSITGAYTGCTMSSSQVGPMGDPFFSEDNIFFIDPGYYGYQPCNSTPFQCVGSTAACGNISSQCITFSFVVNQMPDSLRVFGVEGGGNAQGGCRYESDMMIDLSTLPVDWYDVAAIAKPSGIQVSWKTANEENIDLFAVERSSNGSPFEVVGTVKPSGIAGQMTNYSLLDEAPHNGSNLYRVVEYTKDGYNSTSPLAEAFFGSAPVLAWTSVGPNPVEQRLKLGFVCPEAISVNLDILNISGQLVASKALEAKVGANEVEFDLEGLEPGLYFIRLGSGLGSLTYKIIKV